MKYQIVTEHASKSETFVTFNPVACFAARGFTFNGINENARQRKELQGLPKFNGLCGPMWNGFDDNGTPTIRYEDWGSYELLSS